MKRLIICLIILLTIQHQLLSQISVSNAPSIENLVRGLAGDGVIISNITCDCFRGSYFKDPALGYFKDIGNKFGVSKGLIMTTGSAKGAQGPNNAEDYWQDNNTNFSDQDLEKLIKASSSDLKDVCSIEFDLVASSPFLSFNYVFASEEYDEFQDYNDVFGFFISGPGFNGITNLAVVPGTNKPVSVSSINDSVPETAKYYRDNNKNSNSGFRNYTQYDGFTVPLVAEAKVIPCETYHLKLAIADYEDAWYDSGVFIEGGSMQSSEPGKLSVHYQNPVFSYAVEKCNQAFVVVHRNPLYSPVDSTLELSLSISGTAEEGSDFQELPTSVILKPGILTDTILVDVVYDGIEEGLEEIEVFIPSTCKLFPQPKAITVPIRDYYIYPVQNELICERESVTINENFFADSIVWEQSPYLSCHDCLSPVASPDTNTYFPFLAYDYQTACQSRDSILVSVHHINPDFTYSAIDCMTSLDASFSNHSTGANAYWWDFGDGSTSDKHSPTYTYKTQQLNEVAFQVTLTATNTDVGCSESVSQIITIDNPLYIPNLITANQDGLNDKLEVQGLLGDCWTLKIFNRWGSTIYTASNYRNDWEATDLPPDIYFYSFENDDKSKVLKGWIQIIR